MKKISSLGKFICNHVRQNINDCLTESSEQHWGRIVMNRETNKLVQKLSPGRLKALEISGTYWKATGFTEYKTVSYPDFDICEEVLGETFDLIIAEQVFEHLKWPYRGGRNVLKMLNSGGHFLVTTPFLILYHGAPGDYSRWTEYGLKHLLAECGFPIENIHTGSWGNRACVKTNFKRWARFRPWIHSLKNEPDFPFVVWALARKNS